MSSPSGPPAKRLKLDSTEDTVVLVGPNEKPFTIPKILLTRRSTLFKAALEGEFKEANERKIRLPESETTIFEAWVQWAHTGEIVLLDPDQVEHDVTGSHQNLAAIRLYILADHLGDFLLQNRLIDGCIDRIEIKNKGFPSEGINLIYEKLPESCALRKLIVSSQLLIHDVPWMKRTIDDLPKEFFADIACGWATGIRNKDIEAFAWKNFKTLRGCTLHVHNEDVPKCM